MDRLFKRSNTAKCIELDKMWDFRVDPENKGVEEKWFLSFPDDSRKINVPSCWNTEIDLFRYIGTAWYRTTFETESENIAIKFFSVNNEADVYLDGEHLGNHYGAFLEFGYEIKGLSTGKHTLTVRVNNDSNSVDTYPLTDVDWLNYGGIARRVEIRELSDVLIKDCRVRYKIENDYKDVRLDLSAKIKTFRSVKDKLEVYINDELEYEKELTLDGEEEIEIPEILIKDASLWGIFKPNLYYIKVKFGGEDLIERTGFREIKTEHMDILLNGEKIKLLGINRHEIHPDWGFTMPFNLIKKDIDIIKNLNCNAIRTSHYPNSQLTADYCDEVGMLFWEELPLWGRPEAAMVTDLTKARVLPMIEEMINAGFNHPSIVIISMHNECATDTKGGYEFTKMMMEKARSLDNNRLFTHVTNRGGDVCPDICYEFDDIICMNKYIGWYEGVESGDWNAFIERWEKHIEACNSLDKPRLMTEFGAGAIPGVNTFEAQRWTEDYQADYLEFSLNQLLSNAKIAGTYIWQYCDIHIPFGRELARPRSFNNKGIVDEYRRPKRAYRVVQEIYGKEMSEGAHFDRARINNYSIPKWK
ncbi:MAG: beta-glucuronidase [Clostridia bacterium]|nr:beta-glucuronidase [Clostridia bacterium]